MKKWKEISSERKLELVLSVLKGPDSIAKIFEDDAGLPQQYYHAWKAKLLRSAELIYSRGDVLKQLEDARSRVAKLKKLNRKLSKDLRTKARDDLEFGEG
jgi:hypothetical protein